jgi:hypothetical protein
MRRLVIALTVGIVALTAPAAGATTVAFESPALADGTQVTTQFSAGQGVRFVTGAPTGAAALPVMRVVPGAQARSGTHVLNVSNDSQEFPRPDFAGAFSTTRSTVSLYARAPGASVALKLDAYNSAGTIIASSPVHTLATADGWYLFTAATTGGAETIAAFRLHFATGPANADVLVDDLSYDDPVTPPPADFAIAADSSAVRGAAGASITVPLTINRVNGSSGAILLSGAGSDIGATFSPNPVPADETSVVATLRLPSRDDDFTATIVGVPQVPGAGAASRSLRLAATAELPADLRLPTGGGTLSLPPCSTATQGFSVRRATGLTAPITFGTRDVPANVPWSFTPETLTGDAASGAVTFRRGDDAEPATAVDPRLVAGAEGLVLLDPQPLHLDLPGSTLTAAAGAAGPWRSATPVPLASGDTVTITGSGLCPGSRLRFGNAGAEAPLTVSADGTHATATVPRLATDGPLTVVSPGGRTTVSDKDFSVGSYRHTNGFRFPNETYRGDLTSWLDLYGAQQFFLQADPCAVLTFGAAHCAVPTPIPNPLSFLVFAVADPALAAANGSCFGFALASRRIAAGQGPSAASFGGPDGTVWSIPDTPAIKRYIYSQHVAQISAESLAQQWQQRIGGALSLRSAGELRARIERAVRAGSRPLLSLAFNGHGHAVNAYDIVDVQPSGAFTIRIYNSNTPYKNAEEAADGGAATQAETDSTITVAADGQWTLPELDWHGGLGDIVVLDERALPVHPTLPTSPESIISIMFGAGAPAPASAAAVAPTAKDLLRVPILDDPTPAPLLVGDDRVDHTLSVVPASGKLDTLFAGGGRSARVTGSGIAGPTTLDAGANARSLGLDFRRAAHVELALASRPSAKVTRSLTATFSGAAGGASVALSGNAYTVVGGGGTVRLAISAAGAGALPAVFAGAPLSVPAGAKLSVRPDWHHLDRPLTVVIRAGGRVRAVRVGNRARAVVRVSAVRVKATRKGRDVTVTVTARVSRHAKDVVGAIGVTLRRGGKVVASKGVGGKGAGLRRAILKLRLPAGAVKGPWDVRAAVTSVGAGSALSAPSTARGRATLR